jgi:succinoglycan biosynthesis transport protein ExoP
MYSRISSSAAAGPIEPLITEVEEFDLRQALKTLWRRRRLVLAVIVIITGAMAAYVQFAAPQYQARLQILFDSNPAKSIDFEAALQGERADEASILGEIQVIQSRQLAQRVVAQLDLEADPEFNADLRPDDGLRTLIANISRLFSLWLPRLSEAEDAATPAAAAQRALMTQQAIVHAFLKRLSAEKIGRSPVINVSFESGSPSKAAQIVNTVAELYLVARLEDKFANARRSSKWLAERADKIRTEVEQAERTAAEYRKAHNLLEGERFTLLAEHVSQLNEKLTTAATQRAEAEANLAQVRRLVASSADVSSASQVLESSLYQKLREQEVQLERKEAELSDLGPRHPSSILIQTEKTQLKQNVDSEVRKVIRNLENNVNIAIRRETAIQNELNDAKNDLASANSASVELRSLERDAEANRLLLDRFMTAFTEQTAQQDAESQVPDARVISAAAIPTTPSFPMKALMIALAFLLSSVIGLLLAFAIEMIDAGYRSATQIENDLGLPVLSHVPQVKREGGKRAKLVGAVLDSPASAYAEAIRTISTRLMFACGDRSPRSVLFVSSEASEGKTTIAVSLARMQGRMGRKVILLDADFRHSRVSDMLSLSPSHGMLDLLNGTATVEDVVQEDSASGMAVITAGEYSSDYVNLMSREKLAPLLGFLETMYDLVVIDAPPVRALVDPQLLSSMVDATVLIVKWGHTSREVIRYTSKRINETGGNLAGIVFSQVDVKSLAQYHYGDAGYYTGKDRKYYTA